MAVEIERKFLVTGDAWRTAASTRRLVQGYLNRDPARTVRVRRDGDHAFITVKGITRGATRSEFEYPVPAADADALLALCERPIVEKLRHVVPYAGLCWEIDEFLGDNAGLIVAEVELTSEDQAVQRPPWIGVEVTHDPRYFNSNLALHPWRNWPR